MGERVLVSVVMITYGHEKYIRQAIEGVLMQQGDFDLELVIANDCSPDNTDAIIRQIILKNKSKCVINYFLHENNLGVMPNFNFALEQCKGQYIALCEGDDYWTDPLKLQKQVDFLEENEDYVLSHTDVMIDEDSEIQQNNTLKCWNYKNDKLDYRFAVFSPLAFTCTALYRNVKFRDDCVYKILSGDWMLWVKLTLIGNAKFLNNVTAVYRKGVGVSVNAIWHKDFNERARFLLNQLSLNYSIIKNIWIIRSALYFKLVYLSNKYNVVFFKRIASKLKYKINENR